MFDHASDNLRRLMSRSGLTIEQLAARSRLDQRTIRGILDGSNRPHAKTLNRLAAALGVSPDEFFLDPARLVYRCFDQATNPVVAEVVENHPELFSGWTEADYEELNSRFGTGGPLTVEGTLTAVDAMNRNRSTLEKLAVLLESSQAELIRGIVEVMFDKVASADAVAAPLEDLSRPARRPVAP